MSPTLFPADAELEGILVGPDSVTWQRASDVRLNLVMAYALLLQVAHPTVAAAVGEHSDFERRPYTRLLHTVDYLTLLVYGSGQAPAAGRRLRELHKRFRGMREDGRRYHALEPTAYAWVHATLIQSYVVGHAHFGNPMSPQETEQFYREYRRLGRLIGIRERDLPPTWPRFCTYFERMISHELTRTEAVERVLSAIREPPPPGPGTMREMLWRLIRLPAADALRLGGVGPMPPTLRRRLEISWNWHDEARVRALGLVSRNLGAIMPPDMKVTGPAQLRARQADIELGPLGQRQAA